MKKLIFLTLLLISSSNANEILNQESSGVFLGFGIGAGNGTLTINNFKTNGTNLGKVFKDTENTFNYEGRVGYKYFFNQYVGLRGYGNVSYSEVSKKATSLAPSVLTPQEYTISLITYGINADVLVNFYNDSMLNVGVFGGFGIGGINVNYNDKYLNFEESFNSFYADAKLGLRLNIINHGIELGAKIPLTEAEKALSASVNMNNTTHNANFDAKVKTNYIIYLNYAYTF
ncbi:MAG: outer membrane protein [Helicobacteraceae bacterium]|nr:outer membrane protein [Helicobacteraceae bacterium]